MAHPWHPKKAGGALGTHSVDDHSAIGHDANTACSFEYEYGHKKIGHVSACMRGGEGERALNHSIIMVVGARPPAAAAGRATRAWGSGEGGGEERQGFKRRGGGGEPSVVSREPG